MISIAKMSQKYGEDSLLSYNEYLKVRDLLTLQNTLSEPTSHDELLFIIIHQTYELWFKQLLHELDACIGWIGEERLFRANHSLRGVISIERILVMQIHILESMAPIGFLEFRDKLNPASGFQSMQFRELEFTSGAKDAAILESFKKDEFAFQRLTRRFGSPSLVDAFWSLLEKRGFPVGGNDERVKTIVEILAHPEKHAEIYNMQDLLIEHDELIISWRYNHIQMVERMLGMKRGTGGSEGVGYLMTTLKKKFFPELWEARTHLSIEDVGK